MGNGCISCRVIHRPGSMRGGDKNKMKTCGATIVSKEGIRVSCCQVAQRTLTIKGQTRGVCESCYWSLVSRQDATQDVTTVRVIA